jgi:hypothetical protein
MLDYAYFYQNELSECIRKVLTDENLFFYFMHPSKFFSLRIDLNDHDSIQFVSKTLDDKIIGFLAAYISHDNNCIYNLDLINFTGKPNLIFSKDTKLFFDEIFIHRNFRKIVFHAIEQNPATKMYRKLIEKLGGKEVGILKENVKLTDGNYYDEVIFEIYRDVYTQVKK